MTALDSKIADLIAHAYANAPAIKQLLDHAGVSPADIQGVDDLTKLPVTSKDRLVEIHQKNPPFGGFLAINPDDLPRIFVSPGPILDPQAPNPEPPEDQFAPFEYVGFGKGDRVLNTFAYHLTPAGFMVDIAVRSTGATVLPTGPGNTEVQINMMMGLRATGFAGQPSYLATILDKCAEMGIPKEGIPLKKAIFSAEVYTEAQRARFEGEYGMKTTSIYGTADLGFIGYTREGVNGFVISKGVFMEIVDPNTGQRLPAGEIGEVVVTTFNKAYPLIRFGTGDLGSMAAGSMADTADGENQILTGLHGRSGGAVKVRGMFLHPNQLRAALMAFPQISQIQAVVTRPENKDVLTVSIELHDAHADAAPVIGDQLKALAENAARLRIDEVIVVPKGTIDPEARMVVDERVWE